MPLVSLRVTSALSIRFAAPVLIAIAAASCGGDKTPISPTTTTTTTQPPIVLPALTIACPASVSAAAPTSAGAAVTFAAPSAAGGVAPVQVSCTRESGSTFAVGTTPVQCTARDSATPAAQTASCTFNVTVTPPAPRLFRTRFLAFGDSMTAGEIVTSVAAPAHAGGERIVRMVLMPQLSYPTQLAASLQARYTAQSIEMFNAGRSGEWAEDARIRFTNELATSNAEVVLLLHGINDIIAQGQRGVAPATSAIDTMAKAARARGARLFLATLPPPRTDSTKAPAADFVAALNTGIRATALGEGAVLVDLYAGMVSNVNAYIGPDGLHPNEAGYRRMAELFFDAIRADLEVR